MDFQLSKTKTKIKYFLQQINRDKKRIRELKDHEIIHAT